MSRFDAPCRGASRACNCQGGLQRLVALSALRLPRPRWLVDWMTFLGCSFFPPSFVCPDIQPVALWAKLQQGLGEGGQELQFKKALRMFPEPVSKIWYPIRRMGKLCTQDVLALHLELKTEVTFSNVLLIRSPHRRQKLNSICGKQLMRTSTHTWTYIWSAMYCRVLICTAVLSLSFGSAWNGLGSGVAGGGLLHPCISVCTCGWYVSVYVCPYVCMVSWVEGQMKENQSNPSWRGEPNAQSFLQGDKGRRHRPGLDCQLLVITLILQKRTQRPTDWMTDAHTNRKRQDAYLTQVYSLNHLLNLVAIPREVSLYILWVIKYSRLQSLARGTGRPSQNSREERWQDGTVVKATHFTFHMVKFYRLHFSEGTKWPANDELNQKSGVMTFWEEMNGMCSHFLDGHQTVRGAKIRWPLCQKGQI